MKLFLLGISLFFSLSASEASRQRYLKLLEQYPHLVEPRGDASRGEIEILLDPERMAAIEKKMQREVGLVAQDPYWIWLNDACLFPSGQEGVHGRVLSVKALKSSKTSVAVLPVLPDGRIVLNCNYRHATRSWEIELPRGGIELGEDPETAAKRETKEETGMLLDRVFLLGEMPPDSGLATTVTSIFFAQVREQQEAEREGTEAIEDILFLSLSEIQEAFRKGHYLWKIRGEEKRVSFRDPFLAYALSLYQSG